MPIGVPKVAYRLPGEATPQWVDLYNRLYRERVLFLGSGLDDELANQLNGIMLYLSAEDASRSLFLYINSPGGSVTAGLSVFDIMNYVQASEVVLEKEEIVRLRRLIGRLYVDLTGQSLSTIANDLDRDKYLSAREAREYGLVDLVATTETAAV